MIINYWFIVDDTLLAAATVDGVTTFDASIQATVDAVSRPPPPSFAVLFEKPPSYTLKTAYVHGEYGAQTPLRENLQLLEDALDGDFIVAGCWDFITGAPIGGVGSPWFVTQPELMLFMPGEALSQRHLIMGQGTRQFV